MRYRFGDFELDARRFALFRNGSPVSLEPKPLQLLLYLLERHPEAVSKDELLDALWPEAAITEGSLTRAIRAVRHALREKAGDQGSIRTVRGRGYAVGVDVEQLAENLRPARPPPPKETAAVAASDTPGERRLAAVLSADVVGYSRLLSEDEVRTVTELKAEMARLASIVTDHGGRVIDAVGDNLLAEFSSGVAAVEAAIFCQDLRQGEARDAEPPRLRFRIGLHLGEVLADSERIYGDVVNIAARLEGLAPSGGLAVSEAVAQAVDGKLAIEWQSLGQPQLKNIAKPIRAYFWGAGGDSTTQPATVVEEPAASTGARPMLAVLPFLNLSSDPEQEFLADGLTEDLTTMLASTGVVDVIARTSTFAYKDQARDVRVIGRELGARYLVEGSVRRGGSRVRVTVQLVSADSGAHHFAEKYDRPLKELFDLQDDLVEEIVARIPGVIRRQESARGERVAPEQLDTWGLFHRAYDAFYLQHQQLGDLALATQLVESALEREPDFPLALALRAVITIWPAVQGLTPDAEERKQKAALDARRALDLAPDEPFVLRCWASVLRRLEGPSASAAVLERALSRNPSDVESWAALGTHLAQSGRPGEGQAHIERAIRLSPRDPQLWSWQQFLANVLIQQQRHDEALAAVEQSLSSNPASPVGRATRATLLMRLNREEEAHAQVTRLREDFPQLSLDVVRAVLRVAAPEWGELHEEMVELLAQAGLE